MIDLNGIITPKLNIDIDQYLGVLLFHEFPMTSVLTDNNGNPIIKEWIDASNDGKTDRYFYYKTSKQLLKQFIERKLSHQELIDNSLDGLLYFQDVNDVKALSNFIISVIQLPPKYKPTANYFMSEEDWVDTAEIFRHFELDEYNEEEKQEEVAEEKFKIISIQKKSETLNLHLLKGKGIGEGTIEPKILGRTLLGLDSFYEEAAIDSVMGNERGSVSPTNKEKIMPLYSWEVYEQIRASYSVLIRPRGSNYEIDGKTSFTNIVKKIFDLLQNSKTLDSLKNEFPKHSSYTLNSFSEFVKNIYELELNLDINWFNPENKAELKEHITFKVANDIINNIEQLGTLTQEEIKKNGKFREINLNTGHFIFESTNEEEFKGYFSKDRMEAIPTIDFIHVYQIVILRKNTIESDRTLTVRDIIIGFYLA